MTGFLLFVGVVVVAFGGLWSMNYCVAWLCRDVLRIRFGFPVEHQITAASRRPPSYRWVSLGTSKVSGVVTNTLYATPLDEGLAFEVRSVFRYGLMRPAIVPWSALRPAKSPGPFGMPNVRLDVVDVHGKVVTAIEPGRIEPDCLKRIDAVRATAAEPEGK